MTQFRIVMDLLTVDVVADKSMFITPTLLSCNKSCDDEEEYASNRLRVMLNEIVLRGGVGRENCCCCAEIELTTAVISRI